MTGKNGLGPMEALLLIHRRLRYRRLLGAERLPKELAQRLLSLMEAEICRMRDSQQALEEVAREVSSCRRCPLSRYRTHVVVGEGSPQAEIVFVGEGPGEEEDRMGRPFVGPAGQLLTRIIQAMGLRREDVYIANVVKCRPPGNRVPNEDEIEACRGFLLRQLRAIRPRVICALGGVAAKTLLKTTRPISQLRGRFHVWEESLVMPTYHPSYLLRNPERKRQVWDDMKMVMDLLKPQTNDGPQRGGNAGD